MLRKGYTPTVALFTLHTLIALHTLANTNLITHSVARLSLPIAKNCGPAIALAPYRFQLPKYQAKQYWHPKMNDDKAHRWLRKLINGVACALPPENCDTG